MYFDARSNIFKTERSPSVGAGFIGDPLHGVVYARHGRELMG
ncbi:MAG: hypothetical protein H6Q52_3296 [Deltaproteobacteria bacterium]|nr:hypothetical protein [Deltaproteobacteria bacterium]